MNDFHSRHEPVDAASMTCRPDGGRLGCLGGAARLATMLAAHRQAASDDGRIVVLLDAGDQFQGSLFYTAWHGEVERAVMHALGTDAMAVGNHEFDNGPATLARFIAGARFPVLSANIDAGQDPDLAGHIRPRALLERDGLRIGVVGLTTQETATGSSPGQHVRFDPPGPALAREAATLRAEGAHIVIALSHLGVAADLAMAGQIAGVDVIVGGHSHTLLSDSELGAAGPAHQVVVGPAGHCVVVQAGCYGRYSGRLDLDIAADGKVLAVGGDTLAVRLDVPEQPDVAQIVAGYAAQLDAVRRQVIVNRATPLDNVGCRVGECALGNLITDAMLASVQGADIALINAGGIRTGLPEGNVTLGDVLTALPFGNTVATTTVSGSIVLAALDNGLARAGAGAFPQMAGMRITWNPKTHKLVSAMLVRPDGTTAPLDPEGSYRLVTTNFLRAGGDGYTMLRDQGRNSYDLGPGLDEVLANALPMRPVRVDGRIGVLAQ